MSRSGLIPEKIGNHFIRWTHFSDNRYTLWCSHCYLCVQKLHRIKEVKRYIREHCKSPCCGEVKVYHYNQHIPDNWHEISLNMRTHGKRIDKLTRAKNGNQFHNPFERFESKG